MPGTVPGACQFVGATFVCKVGVSAVAPGVAKVGSVFPQFWALESCRQKADEAAGRARFASKVAKTWKVPQHFWKMRSGKSVYVIVARARSAKNYFRTF